MLESAPIRENGLSLMVIDQAVISIHRILPPDRRQRRIAVRQFRGRSRSAPASYRRSSDAGQGPQSASGWHIVPGLAPDYESASRRDPATLISTALFYYMKCSQGRDRDRRRWGPRKMSNSSAFSVW